MPLITDGAKIRELRERRGWMAADLAERIGTTPGYVMQIESGGRNGSGRMIRQIAEAFSVDIADISDYRPRADKAAS